MTIQVSSIVETGNTITVVASTTGTTVTVQDSGYRGPKGAQGTQGVQGTQGETGSQGIGGSGFTWRGQWNSSTVYLINDAVEYQNSSYVAITNHTNDVPPGTNWNLIAKAGSQGTQGVFGAQGTQGLDGLFAGQGATGSQGVQGTTGSQGTIGTQGFTGTQGSVGTQGTFGTQGTTGSQGIQGRQGTTGTQGTFGVQGTFGAQGLTGSQGIQGIQGETGIQGLDGVQGFQGAPGERGDFGGASFYYNFLTKTDSNDPGAGKLNLNAINFSSTTNLTIDDLDRFGSDISGFLQTIDDSTSDIKGTIKISEEANTLNFVILHIVGTHTEHQSHFDIPVAYVNGTTTPYANNSDVIISFAVTGNKGDTGAQGLAGTQGIQGTFGPQGAQGIQGPIGTGSNVTVAANNGLAIDGSDVLSTIFNTTISDGVQSVAVGGAAATDASVWRTRNIVQVLDTILFPDIDPTYTIPTITLTSSITGTREIGETITPLLTANGVKNDANTFTQIVFRRGASTTINTNTALSIAGVTNVPDQFGYSNPNNPNFRHLATYTDSFVVVSGATTWLARSSYNAGVAKKNNKGVTDTRTPAVRLTTAPQAACTTFDSATTTVTGIYPYFWGVSSTQPTASSIASAIAAGTTNKVLAVATGTVTVTFNASSEYVWLAHIGTATSKTKWYNTALNNGDIGAGQFILAPVNQNVNSPDGFWSAQSFKIYISGFATTTSGSIEFRNT